MATTTDHRAIEYMARSCLIGQSLLGCDFRNIGPSSLLFGSEMNVNGPMVVLNITSNTWFQSTLISEKRCSEEHLVDGKLFGKHISWVCPQFTQQAKRYKGWKVEDVRVNGKILTLNFDEILSLVCDSSDEDEDIGWCLSSKMQMFIAQFTDSLEPYGSIPDEVQNLFNQGWNWTSDDQ